MSDIKTVKLSKKNQISLPNTSSVVQDMVSIGSVFGIMSWKKRENGEGKPFPILRIMTEQELKIQEQVFLKNDSLTHSQKDSLSMKLHANSHKMSLDGQNRIVLPKHFVSHLSLDSDIELFPFQKDNTIVVWKPADYIEFEAEPTAVDLSDFGL